MFKPLSIWKYYCNNQKQVGVVIIVTFLSAIIQSALLIYATSLIETYQRTAGEIWNRLTCAGYLQRSQTKQGSLQKSLVKYPAVAKILPFGFLITAGYGLGYTSVFLVEANEIQSLMNSLNLELIQGRLPAPGSHEIVMHWQLAANKGLKIGDRFGNKVSKLESFPGEFRLVGLLDGKAVLCFADLDRFIADYQFSKNSYGFVIIPKKGQLKKIKSYLAKLLRREKNLFTSAGSEKSVQKTAAIFILLLYAVYVTITGIVTLCVVFLFHLFFYQRRPEFGLLEVLGYNRYTIAGRAFLEILGINLLGFGVGTAVVFLSGSVLNNGIFIKRGLPLVLWEPGYPCKLLAIPLFITICSLIPVWRMITKVGPIAMIEGEE